jgi:hypothetical protein
MWWHMSYLLSVHFCILWTYMKTLIPEARHILKVTVNVRLQVMFHYGIKPGLVTHWTLFKMAPVCCPSYIIRIILNCLNCLSGCWNMLLSYWASSSLLEFLYIISVGVSCQPCLSSSRLFNTSDFTKNINCHVPEVCCSNLLLYGVFLVWWELRKMEFYLNGVPWFRPVSINSPTL